MCFSPQRRAIFRHRNFKKCPKTLNCLAFWLQHVLLATVACNFWFLLWPHDSAPAALTSLLFDTPDTRIIEKTQHFATSSQIWRGCIFFLLTFTLLHLLSFDFTSAHLLFICFSTLHIVGSLLFKLPSIIYNNFFEITWKTHNCSWMETNFNHEKETRPKKRSFGIIGNQGSKSFKSERSLNFSLMFHLKMWTMGKTGSNLRTSTGHHLTISDKKIQEITDTDAAYQFITTLCHHAIRCFTTSNNLRHWT